MSISEKQTPPSLSPINKRHWWVLNETWSRGSTTIPNGFTTDLDSVPHVPGIFALYKGRSRSAALVHDYHYATGGIPRKSADLLFLRHMQEDDVPEWIAYSMYLVVRWFGWRYYRRAHGRFPKERLASRLADSNGSSPYLEHTHLRTRRRTIS